jgi:hypothetical protein
VKLRRGEDGQIGGVEAAIFGVLVFVFGTLVVVNAWAVVDAKLAASSAAREATRSYVEAPSAGEAGASAQRAAEEAIRGHGRQVERLRLRSVEGRFTRCARVTLEASYKVPLLAIPVLGQRGTDVTVAARHSEIVDPYRSGLGGEATCGG